MTTVNAGRANDHRFQTHKTATLLKPSNADMNKPTPRCTTCRIKNKSLLHNCQPDLLEELSDSKLIQSFKKGERLITEGEEARAVYCVRSGVAKAEMHDSQDKTLLLRLEGEGSILGYRVSGKKDKQPLTLTAVENMQVCRIPIEQFRGMTAKSQALRSEIMKHLLAEVHEAESRALTLACHSVKERVAGALLLDVTETENRQQAIIDKAEQVIQNMLGNAQEIAFSLGRNAARSEGILNSIIAEFRGPDRSGSHGA